MLITIEEMNQAILDHAASLDAATRSDAYRKYLGWRSSMTGLDTNILVRFFSKDDP